MVICDDDDGDGNDDYVHDMTADSMESRGVMKAWAVGAGGGGGEEVGEWQRRRCCRGKMLLAFRSHKACSLHAFYMAEAISSHSVQSHQK